MGKRKLVKGAMPTLNLPEYAVLNEIHNYAVANAKDGATQLIKIESYKVLLLLKAFFWTFSRNCHQLKLAKH